MKPGAAFALLESVLDQQRALGAEWIMRAPPGMIAFFAQRFRDMARSADPVEVITGRLAFIGLAEMGVILNVNVNTEKENPYE